MAVQRRADDGLDGPALPRCSIGSSRRRARLYTEMVTADAVVLDPRERLIGFDAFERPLALQLGGSDPARLARAAESAPISAMTKSTSIAGVLRIASRTVGSAPA